MLVRWFSHLFVSVTANLLLTTKTITVSSARCWKAIGEQQMRSVRCRIPISFVSFSLGKTFSNDASKKRPSHLNSNLFSVTSNDGASPASRMGFVSYSSTKNNLGVGKGVQFPIYYNDVYEVALPANHRFPMDKYRQVREMVQKRVSRSDSYNVKTSNVTYEFRVSPLATVDELVSTHDPSYVDRYLRGDLTNRETRNVGFPWSLQHVDRSLSSVGGTLAAARSVCERLVSGENGPAWAAHVAGGTHHAFYDYGEGFCVFSDIAVAANVVLSEQPDLFRGGEGGILVVDLDVHQGNGNARLFHGNDRVRTFSMHCDANIFSAREESDLDVALPVGCTDDTYLSTLRHWLRALARNKSEYDLIFYQAGVDVLGEDRLGKLLLTREGVRRRNEMVFEFARETNKGFVVTMGGGYPRGDDWSPILEAHCDVYTGAYDFLCNFND